MFEQPFTFRNLRDILNTFDDETLDSPVIVVAEEATLCFDVQGITIAVDDPNEERLDSKYRVSQYANNGELALYCD